jgi:hypothetical protein
MEEDCCGARISWDQDIEYCIPDKTSSGFDGTYKSNPNQKEDVWNVLVARRMMATATLAGRTIYDPGLGCCIPK